MVGNALTRGDILGCLRAVAAFAPILFAPGYCVAWACNLLGFRNRPAWERITWGIALSFGLMTTAAIELGRYASLSAVCWLAGLCALGALAILIGEFWKGPRGLASRWCLLGAGIAAAWTLFVVLELVDVAAGGRLYLGVTIFDHALRTAFVDAVMRTGVPPANPLYWPGHAAPMRYYYFWYVLAAAAARLGAATARQAMIASVVWSGFGLAAVLALYCGHFLGPNQSGSEPLHGKSKRRLRTVFALGLLAVTGLDILPALVKAVFRLPTDADMEWWSSDQVTSWIDSLLWAPHHIAGLVCCLLGFLLVWMSKGCSAAQRTVCMLFAGLSFASAFGLSTWVAVGFAMVMLAWLVWVLWWEPESRGRVPVLLCAGVVAALALIPYLGELRRESSGVLTAVQNTPAADRGIASGAASLLSFGVRHMIDPDSLLGVPWLHSLARAYPRVEDTVAGLILLIPGYFTELGFYGLVLVVAVAAARRQRLEEAGRTALVLTLAALVATTFLHSTVISNDDFGMRSTLIAQFFLLLLAVCWWEGAFGATGRTMRATMMAMLWIGLAGTVYQAVVLRAYLPVEDKLDRPDEAGLSERAMALRRAFDAMDQRVPKTAIIQFNTGQPSDFFHYAQVMQAGRQMANALPECAAAFGGDASACPGIQASVARLFTPVAGRALPEDGARIECGRLGASDLVATRWDGVWFDPEGWVWKLPAVVDTGDVRVVDCSHP